MSDRSPSTRADARRNREHLLAAARAVFAEHGTQAPLDGVARRAGLGSGTLYRHFPTRESLLREVYWGEIEGLWERARELASTTSPGDALTGWLRSLIQLSDRRGLAAALLSGVSQHRSRFIDDCHRAITDAAAPLLERAQASGAYRSDVTLEELLRLVHALAWTGEGADDADHLLELILGGLRLPGS
jgi:AcrR family transcriptional regulator